MTLDVGSRIRDYEIVARLKAGGMATLFLARRGGAAGFSRHVAIKVVHPHLAADPEFIRMFIDEAMLSARISHPNVVHVEELGQDPATGAYFLAMEYVHGSALSTLLGGLARLERRLSPEIAVSIAASVLDGLHAAHELRDEAGQALGVVHRDVSPQNVLVATAGHVKLIDFGIAKVLGQSKRTETGALKGKLRYMAPEQAYGRAVDRRTDVYALAIVLWEMLTMHRMFGQGNDLAVLDEVRSPRHEPPSRFAEGVPPALDRALLWALSIDPAARPQTALELKRALFEAVPGAASVDSPRLAEIVDAVLGERIEQRRAALPESLSGVSVPAGQPTAAGRRLDRGDALQQLTISAPGTKYRAESDVSDLSPSVSQLAAAKDAGTGVGASAGPLGVPLAGAMGAPNAGVTGGTFERKALVVAGAVTLVSLGVAAGALLGGRPVAPAGGGLTATPLPVAAPAVAAPLRAAVAPPTPSTEPTPSAVSPDAGVAAVAMPAEPALPSAASPSSVSPSRGGPRRGGASRDDDRARSVVDGVPIYEDDSF